MDGNALEVALALWRIPSMRTSLRQRPLPSDVGELIELAAGTPERLAKAAARLDETPAAVLEAARFYVREVLLCDGADAYRVLGVSRDAAPEQIKAHHRALQHWLHPDRRGDDWESVYATRINTAWGELRSPEHRAAYDALNAQRQMSAETVSAPRRVLVTEWRAAPANQSHWRGWLALGAAVVACVWLIVLVDRQASAPVPEWNVAPEETPTTDRALPPSLAAAVERVRSRQRPTNDLRTRAPAQMPSVSAATAPAQDVAAAVAEAGEPPRAMAAAPVNAMASAMPVPTTKSVADAMAVDDSSVPAVATEPRIVRKRTPVRVVASAVEPVATSPAQFERGQAAAAAMTDDSATLQRVRLAHSRGRELTQYLAGLSNRVPPIWRSVSAQDAAASIRDRLEGGRSRVTRIFSRVRFGDPDWRIAADRATMTSTIRRGGSGADAATLRVELAWRDGMWLVDTIAMENQQ